MDGIAALYAWKPVIHLQHGGLAEETPLVDEAQQFHIHAHQQDQDVSSKREGITRAGVGMELVDLHPLELG
jgi:hypothetical protein